MPSKSNCPKCGSENVEYEAYGTYEDDNYEVNGVCHDCGCEFMTRYHATEQTIIDKH